MSEISDIVPYRESDIANQNLALSSRHNHGRGDRVNLNALVATLKRRRLLFFCVAGGVLALVLALTFLMTPTYIATAQVVIDTAQVNLAPPVTQDIVQDQDSLTSGAVDTEVQVILSTELANKVVESLKLDNAAAFDPARTRPSKISRLKAWWTGTPIPPSRRSYDPAAQRDFIVNQLTAGLQVLRIGTTFSLTISFSSPDPDFATTVANEYARQYTLQSVDRKRTANQQALAFLSGRMQELQKQSEADNAAVQRYRVANNLLSANAAQLTEGEVSTYDQQLAGARASAAEDQARLDTAQRQLHSGSKGDDVGETLESPVISTYKTQRASLAAQLANLRTRYGDKYPDVLNTQAQIANLDKSIQEETTRVISNLQAKVSVSKQRLGSVAGSLSGARGTLQTSNTALVGFEDLSNKAAASQALYQAYLNRYKEASAEGGTEQAAARVISLAQTPGSPSSPNLVLNTALGIILGIGAGLITAFIAELLFSGLTTGEEVETRLGVPYLGSIPLLKSLYKKPPAAAEAVLHKEFAGFAESFRNLRTSIAYSSSGRSQVIAITSALPKEGKSTTAVCLARVTALDDRTQRVVLIDCDLKRRSLNRFTADTEGPGLMEVLSGESGLHEALMQDVPSGAWILPLRRSPVSRNLLTGDAMLKLLERLREEFTLIIIDAPPILPIAETRVLSTYADAVVFVVRWRKVADHAVRTAMKLLPEGRTNLAGILLTQVDMKKQGKLGAGEPGYYYNQYKDYYA